MLAWGWRSARSQRCGERAARRLTWKPRSTSPSNGSGGASAGWRQQRPRARLLPAAQRRADAHHPTPDTPTPESAPAAAAADAALDQHAERAAAIPAGASIGCGRPWPARGRRRAAGRATRASSGDVPTRRARQRDHLEPVPGAAPWLLEHLLVEPDLADDVPVPAGADHSPRSTRCWRSRVGLAPACSLSGRGSRGRPDRCAGAWRRSRPSTSTWTDTSSGSGRFRLLQRERALDPASLAALLPGLRYTSA